MFFPASLPVLTTPRLLLRPFAPDDGPVVERLAGEKRVADTTLLIPHPYPAGAAAAWIGTHAAKWSAHESGTWAINLGASRELIGCISLAIDEFHHCGELGYWLGWPYWNQGYTTEATRAVIACAFHTVGLHRVQAHHFAQNPASGRVLAKAGLNREGLSVQARRKHDAFCDVVFYGALREHWR